MSEENKIQEVPAKVWRPFCEAVRAARELFPGDTDREITRKLIDLVCSCDSFSPPWERGHEVWTVLHLLVTSALKEQNLPVNDEQLYSEELSHEETTRRQDLLTVNHEYQQAILRDCAGVLADVFDAEEIIDTNRPEAGNILTDLSFLKDEEL